ncbi:MAG: AAA family ATPase [Candidatus Magasanikbacteria bacterium]|nr:AAA family ATPase [Candidatus Magasanikbacteria bacterium]MBT4071719.1 AAA family ATPase [Candidatus Magasanikbacteria bacterium]
MPITFSKKAQLAIDKVQETNDNIFVTGKAGTGKSTLLEYIRNYTSKKIILLAPTGISAININGDTIHSFFKLKPGFEKAEAEKMRIDEKKEKKFKRIETIAIDEISMVRADLLDAIDIVLRRTRKNDQPFGGVQMVFFGDLYQLPPVVTSVDREKFFSEYTLPYFFGAEVFKTRFDLFSTKFELEIIELTEMYRQKDMDFIHVLNAVRNNSVDHNHLNTLNTRFFPDFTPEDKDNYIYLMTTNASARKVNDEKLAQLPEEERMYLSEKTGDIAKNLHPNDEMITIKVGAQVMFICNDAERKWVNGTIGKVIEINGDRVLVEKTNGDMVDVKKHTWEISRYTFDKGQFEREIIGSFTQMPMKLAWAITIHKSQGKTFDKVIIDLGRGSFAHGQTYVALSRCTTLEGVILKKRMYKSSIIMDTRIRNFEVK